MTNKGFNYVPIEMHQKAVKRIAELESRLDESFKCIETLKEQCVIHGKERRSAETRLNSLSKKVRELAEHDDMRGGSYLTEAKYEHKTLAFCSKHGYWEGPPECPKCGHERQEKGGCMADWTCEKHEYAGTSPCPDCWPKKTYPERTL